MNRQAALLLSLCLSLLPFRAVACDAHLVIDPDKLGFVGGALVRMAGLAPPEPVFELEHPAMVKARIGEQSEISVNYSRPFFSKNVTLKVKGSTNVKIEEVEYPLEDRNGSLTIPYELAASGFDTIILTVSGEDGGEMVTESARIYVRARPQAAEPEIQVSER